MLGLAESQAADLKVFAFPPPSPPPPRRGQGWWFAVLRSSAAAIKMCHRHLIKPICVQYGFRFFGYEKSESVSSAAKHQRGLQRGKPGSPLPCFASFCRSKRKAPAASGDNYAFAKGPAPPPGDHKLALNSHNKSQLLFPNKTHHLSGSHPVFPHFVNLP